MALGDHVDEVRTAATVQDQADEADDLASATRTAGAGPKSITLIWALALIVVLTPTLLGDIFTSAALGNWGTIFLSLTLQALPFLVLGVLVSALISAFVSADRLARTVPRRPAVAIPAAGLAGAILPGCECSSVPVASRLVDKGAPPAAALAFLLSAPAINPVVLVSTAVAFPGMPEMVAARFLASLLVAITVGAVWSRFASPAWLERRFAEHASHHHGRRFVDAAAADLVQAGGFLTAGAAVVATLHTVVPASAFDGVAGDGVVAIIALALLAILLSVCSEADAFVAAGLTQFSLTSRLVFLVVGPMIDLKLIALHAGTFGRGFALRFDPLVLGVAVVIATVVGNVLL